MVKTQYCWTVLPQGFNNSPTTWGEMLSKDLKELQFQKGVLLQHVDDLLITGATYEDCLESTIKTLNHLADCGYKVSASKAQISRQAVLSLGFALEPGINRGLQGDNHSDTISKNKEAVKMISGNAGYFHIWVPNFGLIAKPLCEALKGPEDSPLE